jgi:hypothetical protein
MEKMTEPAPHSRTTQRWLFRCLPALERGRSHQSEQITNVFRSAR